MVVMKAALCVRSKKIKNKKYCKNRHGNGNTQSIPASLLHTQGPPLGGEVGVCVCVCTCLQGLHEVKQPTFKNKCEASRLMSGATSSPWHQCSAQRL